MSRLWICLRLAFVALPLLAPALSPAAEVDAFESFRRAASLRLEPLLLHFFSDSALLANLDRLPEGESLPLGARSGGRAIGLAWRERAHRVAALDEDGDLGPLDRRPDQDSDCLLVDLGSDGVLDRVLDWVDLDGDGAADVQVLYEISPGGLAAHGVAAMIVYDLDHDGRFFQVTDYTYQSNRDMWGSDFDGDVCFVAAARDEEEGGWTSAYENPFCFYDADGDGASDEALRLEGRDLEIESMRWSFDADGDAAASGGRDYDVSVTARGRILAPRAFADSLEMRDGRRVRWVSWRRARDLARWAIWSSVLLVWDEEDHNVAPHSDAPERERWEGVIAEEFRTFPAVGGPPCGRLGKRYELDRDGSGRLDLYLSGVDGRIHLTGAEEGELSVVLGGNPALARSVRSEDRTRNGFFDYWTWAGEAPASGARTAIVKDEQVRPLALGLAALRAYALESALRAGERELEEAQRLEASSRGARLNPIRRFWDGERDDALVLRAEKSPEARRLLQDLLLWELGGGFLTLGSLEAADRAVWTLDASAPGECGLVLPARTLLPDARAMLTPASRPEIVSGATRVSGQVDDVDGDGEIDRLAFPPFPRSQGEAPRLVLEPAAPLARGEQVRVDPWFPGGPALESIGIVVRTYGGRLDLMQKKVPRLILRTPLDDIHVPQYWGIDPLEVGEGPGIGGIYVEQEGAWKSWFGSRMPSESRFEAAGPLRAAMRIDLVREEVRMERLWSLQRGDHHIEERFSIEAPAPMVLAFGLAGLEASGATDAAAGIWSYGVSVEAAGAVALAGLLLEDREAAVIKIDGNPALRVRTATRDSLRLAWVFSGAGQGVLDAEAWIRQIEDSGRRLRDLHARCR